MSCCRELNIEQAEVTVTDECPRSSHACIQRCQRVINVRWDSPCKLSQKACGIARLYTEQTVIPFYLGHI